MRFQKATFLKYADKLFELLDEEGARVNFNATYTVIHARMTGQQGESLRPAAFVSLQSGMMVLIWMEHPADTAIRMALVPMQPQLEYEVKAWRCRIPLSHMLHADIQRMATWLAHTLSVLGWPVDSDRLESQMKPLQSHQTAPTCVTLGEIFTFNSKNFSL